MGNRHHNKKLRAAVRATMAKTGESYQSALFRLRGAGRATTAHAGEVDLVSIEYFGVPLTLATFAILGGLSCVVTAGSRLPGPFPQNPLFALPRRPVSS